MSAPDESAALRWYPLDDWAQMPRPSLPLSHCRLPDTVTCVQWPVIATSQLACDCARFELCQISSTGCKSCTALAWAARYTILCLSNLAARYYSFASGRCTHTDVVQQMRNQHMSNTTKYARTQHKAEQEEGKRGEEWAVFREHKCTHFESVIKTDCQLLQRVVASQRHHCFQENASGFTQDHAMLLLLEDWPCIVPLLQWHAALGWELMV